MIRSDKELVLYALSTLKANLDEISLDDLDQSEEILEKRLEELIRGLLESLAKNPDGGTDMEMTNE